MNLSRINQKGGLTFVVAAFGFAALLGACTKSPTDDNGGDEELRAELIAEGQTVFGQSCNACHGEHGEGESGPPLLHSDFVVADRIRPLRILLLGIPNTIDTATVITVNGVTYEGQTMIGLGTSNGWSDRQIAAVLTYVRAVLNDSTSVNCEPFENEDGQMEADCEIIPSEESYTTMITPDEVGALRDSLTEAGVLRP